jgi:hypothetical protein
MTKKITVFWDVTICSPVDRYQLSEEQSVCIFRVERERGAHAIETRKGGDIVGGSELINRKVKENNIIGPLKGRFQ